MHEKEIIISIPDEIFSEALETYIRDTFEFELSSVGCGSTEYEGKGDLHEIMENLITNFGERTVDFLNMANKEDVT